MTTSTSVHMKNIEKVTMSGYPKKMTVTVDLLPYGRREEHMIKKHVFVTYEYNDFKDILIEIFTMYQHYTSISTTSSYTLNNVTIGHKLQGNGNFKIINEFELKSTISGRENVHIHFVYR